MEEVAVPLELTRKQPWCPWAHCQTALLNFYHNWMQKRNPVYPYIDFTNAYEQYNEKIGSTWNSVKIQ